MANHAARAAKADLPEVKWASVVQSDKGWHLATMTTKGDQITGRTLGDPASKVEAEEQYRVHSANDLFGWEDE